MITSPASGGQGRIGALDALRGLAICGMVIYHTAWDLKALGLSAAGPADVVALRWLGDTVAAAFLLISGIALTLAERAGHSWPRKLARLALLALAAVTVTLVTGLVSPDFTIRFGILHCLAVCNAIGLLLRRVPNAALVLAGVGCALLPAARPFSLDARWAWVGLSQDLPATLDFRPVLPWLAFVLFGLASGRTAMVPRLAAIRIGSVAGRGMALGGRHSLAIYLLHQPVLLAILTAVTMVAGENSSSAPAVAPSEVPAFLDACTRSCSAGQDVVLCRATCHCVVTASARPDGGLRGLLARLQSPQARLRKAAERCRPDQQDNQVPDTTRN